MRFFVFAAILAGVAGPALAQEAPAGQAVPAGQAMQLKVSPSGYEAEQNDAQERQEKLLKRMEESDHMIRSICINCGDAWKHQIYAPFNPYASLKSFARPANEGDN